MTLRRHLYGLQSRGNLEEEKKNLFKSMLSYVFNSGHVEMILNEQRIGVSWRDKASFLWGNQFNIVQGPV